MHNKANLYRQPTDPGFIGSYDWRSTVLGLILITGFSFAATEYVAKQFQFHPALGRPVLRTQRYAVYQPFAWTVWGWKYCMSRDANIREPLFCGEMIAFGGSIVTAVIFFLLANRRAGKLPLLH